MGQGPKKHPEDSPEDDKIGNTRKHPEDSPEDDQMGNGEIDRLPVNLLMERYALVRSAVYTRLDALGIKPDRVGNKAYINSQQLKLLDELHQFIQSGGNTAEFLEMKGLKRAEEKSVEESSGLSTVQPDMLQLMSVFATELVSKLQPPSLSPDPLAYFERLEQAAHNGWLLRTTEVAELLKLSATEIQQYGDSFSEAGFTFTRAGYRSGGELAWKVSKPLK